MAKEASRRLNQLCDHSVNKLWAKPLLKTLKIHYENSLNNTLLHNEQGIK